MPIQHRAWRRLAASSLGTRILMSPARATADAGVTFRRQTPATPLAAETWKSAEQPLGRRAAIGLILCLVLANALSFFDRQFVSVAIIPIQNDLALSDVQMGLLGGFSFAICYAIIGLPLSVLIDRYNRVTIIIIGVLVWSLATGLCGLARNFTELFVARMLVGAGEAALAPAAYSLIGSSFRSADIPRATGYYAIGSALGTGLAIAAGGPFLGWLASLQVNLDLRHWQVAFLIFSLLGLPLAGAMAWFLPNVRHMPSAVAVNQVQEKLLPYLWQRRQFYIPLVIASCLCMSFISGFLAWSPTFFRRRYDWSVSETGVYFGSLFLIFNLIAGPVGGLLATWLNRRSGKNHVIQICLVCWGAALALIMLGSLVPNATVSFVSLGSVPLFTGISGYALIPALIVMSTPPLLRGRVVAVVLFIMTIGGYGTGPLLYGWITEHIVGGQSALHLSLALTTPILLIPAILALYLAGQAKHVD
jgi:MFS family permease